MKSIQKRVVFVDQVGDTPGGAQRTLGTFLRFAPSTIVPIALLFQDGHFADELRGLGMVVDIVGTSQEVLETTRESNSLRAFGSSASLIMDLARRFKTYRADVVYTNSMKAHVVGSLAAKLVGVPCVIHYHDLLEGRALEILRLVCKLGSRQQIACSKLVASSMNTSTTHVIYGPVEVDAYHSLEPRSVARQRLGITDDVPTIALIGRINRWKGHDAFVRIAAKVNAVVRSRFVIIGAPVFRDADFVPELEHLIAQLNLEDWVVFAPWVDDVKTVLPAIDINTNCSKSEPFGRTVAEAAAAGIPTICFDDSGASETIHDHVNGRVVRSGDEEAFAAAIIELLIDRELLSRMSREAKIGAFQFDAKLIASQTDQVIQRAS